MLISTSTAAASSLSSPQHLNALKPSYMAETSVGSAANDAATSDASSHNILTIPPELFERIAESSDPEDLPNIRLVNR
jgi:hypothetical protein